MVDCCAYVTIITVLSAGFQTKSCLGTCPSFVRAVPAWAVLRSFGRVLRGTNMNAEELYAMSFQAGFSRVEG